MGEDSVFLYCEEVACCLCIEHCAHCWECTSDHILDPDLRVQLGGQGAAPVHCMECCDGATGTVLWENLADGFYSSLRLTVI